MNESMDHFIERIASELREPESFGPAFTRRVMSRIESGPSAIPVKRNISGWLFAPRAISLSPVTVFACAVLLVTGGYLLASRRAIHPADNAVAGATPLAAGRDTIRVVQFVFVAPSAGRVSLVGDFNNWDKSATPLRREKQNGLWTVSVPVSHGRHQYAFMIDGERWMLDPSAPKSVENSYGTPNSVVTVTADAL